MLANYIYLATVCPCRIYFFYCLFQVVTKWKMPEKSKYVKRAVLALMGQAIFAMVNPLLTAIVKALPLLIMIIGGIYVVLLLIGRWAVKGNKKASVENEAQ